MRVLLTGMCGFVGHHVADVLLETTDWQLVGLDRIDQTSTLHRMHHLKEWVSKSSRVKFVWHDLRAPINSTVAAQIDAGCVGPDVIVHLAASTHVDRSIQDSLQFVYDNVVGTTHLLEYARTAMDGGPLTLINVCTDEVFGPAQPGQFYTEEDRYRGSNPYSGSKAAAEQMVVAYQNTYGFQSVLSLRPMNLVGERQHGEKFLPLLIRKILRGELIQLHAHSDMVTPGERGYIYVRNIGHVIRELIKWAHGGSCGLVKLNLPAQRYYNNVQLATLVSNVIGKPLRYELVDGGGITRPGHDLRYALDGGKFHSMGLGYPEGLEAALEKTIKWYLDHVEWL